MTIFLAAQAKLTSIAKQMLRLAREEAKEIENCPNCLYNAYSLKPDWFIQACVSSLSLCHSMAFQLLLFICRIDLTYWCGQKWKDFLIGLPRQWLSTKIKQWLTSDFLENTTGLFIILLNWQKYGCHWAIKLQSVPANSGLHVVHIMVSCASTGKKAKRRCSGVHKRSGPAHRKTERTIRHVCVRLQHHFSQSKRHGRSSEKNASKCEFLSKI